MVALYISVCPIVSCMHAAWFRNFPRSSRKLRGDFGTFRNHQTNCGTISELSENISGPARRFRNFREYHVRMSEVFGVFERTIHVCWMDSNPFERNIQACGTFLDPFFQPVNCFFFQLHERFNLAYRRKGSNHSIICSTPIQLFRFISSFLDFTFSLE